MEQKTTDIEEDRRQTFGNCDSFSQYFAPYLQRNPMGCFSPEKYLCFDGPINHTRIQELSEKCPCEC
jgi:hypothetical protein